MKFLIAFLLFAGISFAQVASKVCNVSNSQTAGFVLTATDTGKACDWEAAAGGGVTSLMGTANQVTVSAPTGAVTISLPNAVILGTDNTTAGTLQLANGSANAHTIWASGATTTNTIQGFASVPTTGHIVTCTVTSTTCLLTDGGAVPTGASPTGSLGACQFYATSTTFGGDSSVCFENATALSTPAAPVVTPVGMTGATSYSYSVMACNQLGCTAQSTATVIANGNATLDMTNYNSIATVAQSGTTGCVAVSNFMGYSLAVAEVTCGIPALDQGAYGNGVNPTTNETTGNVLSNAVVPGRLLVGDGRINFASQLGTVNSLFAVRGTQALDNYETASAGSLYVTFAPTGPGTGIGVDLNVYVPSNAFMDTNYTLTHSNLLYSGTADAGSIVGIDEAVAMNSPSMTAVNSLIGTSMYVALGGGVASNVYNYYGNLVIGGNASTTNAYASGIDVECGGCTATNIYGYYTNPFLNPSGTVTNAYMFYSKDLAGFAANPYYSWFDSQGVHRCKEDGAFDSVGQSICALYNPQFTKYTPGAPDYERQIQGQWNGNVAEFGTYAGGMGTPRVLRALGSEFHIGTASNLSTTTFMGMGLDDALFNGTYTGADLTYCAIIDGTGTPDTFKWGTNGGCNNGATLVAITGANQALSSGVIIKFAATTGHTATDQWSVTATAATEYAKFNPANTLVGSGSRPLCVMADGTIYPGSFDGGGLTICP